MVHISSNNPIEVAQINFECIPQQYQPFLEKARYIYH